MKRAFIRVAVLTVCMSASAYAMPTDPIIVDAGGKSVQLLLPERTCAYDKGNKYDAGVLQALEKANPKSEVLLAFIDCDNLRYARDDKGATPASPPGYFGEILSDTAGQLVAQNYTREVYVKAIAEQYGKESPERAMARGEDMLRDMLASKDAGAPQTVGVIKRTKDFFQLAVLGAGPIPGGGIQKIVNIITVTKLDVPVSVYLGHVITGDLTLSDFSNHAEIYVRQLIDLNHEWTLPFVKGFDIWSVIAGFVGGVLVTQILGAMLRRR